MSSLSVPTGIRPSPEAEQFPVVPPVQPAWLVELGLAIGFGLFAYVFAFVVTPQVMKPNNFGEFWQMMSVDPFGLRGDFPHRMLGPLLAHYLGMGGQLWVPFTMLTSAVFLCIVFRTARWRGAEVTDAALVTFAVALTGAVQGYKTDMIGYVDNLGYSLTLLIWMSARRGWLFWPLILVNLVNHEMVAFFLPWFLFLRRQVRAPIRADVVGFVFALGLYVVFRKVVGAHAAAWAYDGHYFLEHCFLPFSFLYLWALAAVYQLHLFGPMLAIVVWHLLRPRPVHERAHAVLVIGGFLTVFFLAYDVQRHSNMMFIPLLIASVRFLGTRRSRYAYAALLAATVAISSHYPWVFNWVTGIMTYDCGGHRMIMPENRFNMPLYWEIIVGTFERAWPVLFALAWEALFLLALAQWFARRGIGGQRVSTAGLVLPLIPTSAGGAIASFRRATAGLWRRRDRRDPRVGT